MASIGTKGRTSADRTRRTFSPSGWTRIAPRLSGCWRAVAPIQDEGAIRFKVPPGKTSFADLVHGAIAFDNEHIESFVILRSDGHPTYHLSVVVDDIDMAITHVVRGDDHISNTPKQVLLYQACDAPVPAFAHVPLIMGPDKKRLSKRHGATSVIEYERQGYIREGMVNFLAFLGWSPGGATRSSSPRANSSIASRSKASAAATPSSTRRSWTGSITSTCCGSADEELTARLRRRSRQLGLWRETLATTEREWFVRVLALLKTASEEAHRVRRRRCGRSWPSPAEYDAEAVNKQLAAPGVAEHIRALRQAFAAVLLDAGSVDSGAFDEATLEQTLRQLAETRGVKAGTLIHGTRIAMTGRMVSPGLIRDAGASGPRAGAGAAGSTHSRYSGDDHESA